MTCKIFFLYFGGSGWCERECEAHEAEDKIRYWMGKSPGCHEMETILVVPESETSKWINIVFKMKEEAAEYNRQMEEKEERERYEHLKKKYG